jgi:hypothetical protein
MTERRVLAVTGTDRVAFLQGLVSNDVRRAEGGIVYAALLTPQGKYLADFFLIGQADQVLIDVAAPLAAPLAERLAMYRLRADVQIAPTAGRGPRPRARWPIRAIRPWAGAPTAQRTTASPPIGTACAWRIWCRKAASN